MGKIKNMSILIFFHKKNQRKKWKIASKFGYMHDFKRNIFFDIPVKKDFSERL